MARLTLIVNDDAGQTEAGLAAALANTTQVVGSSTSEYQWTGFRFTGVSLPQAETVRRAVIRLYFTTLGTASTDNFSVSCEDADNAAAFSSTVNNLSGRVLTAAAPLSRTDDLAAGYIDFDITAAVQTVVNRVGWVSGNALVVMLHSPASAGTATVAMKEHATTDDPTLSIVHGGQATLEKASTAEESVDASWSNITNIRVEDGTRSTGTDVSTNSPFTARNFGLTPEGTIDGISVRVKAAVSSDSSRFQYGVELSWDGGISWTAPYFGVKTPAPLVDHIISGGVNNWGRSWTAAELSDTNFRVRVTPNSGSGTADASVDFVGVTVYTGQTITAVGVTKELKYVLRATPTPKQKSLKYTVKTTAGAITKQLRYTVRIVGAITKQLRYTVKASVSVGKTLKYTTKVQAAAVTKSLAYRVRTSGAALTKSLQYRIKNSLSATKSLQYTVRLQAAALTKNLKYSVKGAFSASRSLKYTVRRAFSATKTLQYATKTTPSAITKGLTYRVRQANAATKSLKYSLTTSLAVTKSLHYIAALRGTLSLPLKYTVKSPASTSKPLKYTVRTVTAAITKTLTYRAKSTIATTKALRYAVRQSAAALTKTITYRVRASRAALTKSLAYRVTANQAAVKQLRYNVRTTIGAISKSLVYKTAVPYAISRALRYGIVTGHVLTKSLGYRAWATRSIQKGLAYRIVVTPAAFERPLRYTVIPPSPQPGDPLHLFSEADRTILRLDDSITVHNAPETTSLQEADNMIELDTNNTSIILK